MQLSIKYVHMYVKYLYLNSHKGICFTTMHLERARGTFDEKACMG